MKETDLNAELREKGGIYFKGVDKAGRPIRKQAIHIEYDRKNAHVFSWRHSIHLKSDRSRDFAITSPSMFSLKTS